MKKLFVLGTIVVALLTLSACGGSKTLNGTYKSADDVSPYELTFSGNQIIVDGGKDSEHSGGFTGTYRLKNNELVIENGEYSTGQKLSKSEIIKITQTKNSITAFGKTFTK